MIMQIVILSIYECTMLYVGKFAYNDNPGHSLNFRFFFNKGQ